MCYAPSPDTFPLSALARRSPYRINRTLNLAQSLSSFLMKCNLLNPNIIHHTPASVLRERVCIHTERLSISASQCSCFHFLSYRPQALQSRLKDFNRQGKNKPLWPICFSFYLASALFSTKLISLISFLFDGYQKSQLYLIFYLELQGKFPLLIYAALCHNLPVIPMGISFTAAVPFPW